MKKLLTVIIPAYNAERTLAECIESLLAGGNAEETELLVIDDGSKDKSGLIADNYAEHYPQVVRVVHKENGGHGSAINTGLELASGEYIRVVDSDDTVAPVAYKVFLQKLRKLAGMRCDLVVTPFSCVWQGKHGKAKIKQRKIEGASHLPKEKPIPFKEAVGNRLQSTGSLHVRMHEWTIRTEILRNSGMRLSEHSFYVDMQYILFPVPWIRTICFLDEAVYLYHLGNEGQSMSVKNMQKNRKQHRNVMRSMEKFYCTREAAGDSRNILSYLARGIAKMEASHVQTILSLPIRKAAKEELIVAEQELRLNCPAAYKANKKKSIWMLRKSGYTLYTAAALVWRVVKK